MNQAVAHYHSFLFSDVSPGQESSGRRCAGLNTQPETSSVSSPTRQVSPIRVNPTHSTTGAAGTITTGPSGAVNAPSRTPYSSSRSPPTPRAIDTDGTVAEPPGVMIPELRDGQATQCPNITVHAAGSSHRHSSRLPKRSTAGRTPEPSASPNRPATPAGVTPNLRRLLTLQRAVPRPVPAAQRGHWIDSKR